MPSSACADTIAVSGTSTNCIINGDQETCHLEFSTTVTLQPLSQDMCFVLRDQDNHPAAVLTLRLSSVQHRCNKRILFYTRDHKFYSESSHRCYKAGSCQSERCETTKTNDRLEEFTNSANDSPGFTFCTSSCGCVTCNGCFLCSPSCLFYRYYAWPTSSTVYSIFDCPTWTTTVTGTVTLEKEGATPLTTAFNLDPARPFRWNSFTFTLASHSSPPLPVFGKTYIDNGLITALLPETISNFGLNSPGQLKCLSFEEAKKFSCTFSAEVCNCVPASYSVKCQCTDGDIAQYLTKTPLPIYTQQVMISHSQGTISASTAQGTAVQLIMSTKDLKWTTRIIKNSCALKVHHQLRGCYSCLSGGRLTVSCHSSPGPEIADIQCGNYRTVLRCQPEGEHQDLIFNFDEAEVNMECELKCRFDEPQKFKVEGTLSYVSDVIQLKDNAAPSNTRIHAYDPLEILSSALDWIGSLFSRLLIHIAVVSLVIGVVLLSLWCYYKKNKEKKTVSKNPHKTL